ncbi:hypothetical protein [Halalkalibacter oceani]|uniref:hypothetical protein n=1 Tax=Halalkalibacter oceani TaxID=1653776 RepID=UPI003391F37E
MTDYSVCPKCQQPSWKEMPFARYVIFLSALPVLVALCLTFIIDPLLILFVPIVLLLNMRAAKKRIRLGRCQTCFYTGPRAS